MKFKYLILVTWQCGNSIGNTTFETNISRVLDITETELKLIETKIKQKEEYTLTEEIVFTFITIIKNN